MEKNEDLGTRLENAGKRFFRKTKEFADATKLSIKLKEYELDLDNLYQIAGKVAYYGEDTKEIFTQITNKLEQIEEVKVDIADADGAIERMAEHAHRVDAVDAARAVGEVKAVFAPVVHKDADNLAKAQRYQRQIIAAQL